MKKLALLLHLFISLALSLPFFAEASISPRCEVKVSYHLRSGRIEEAKVRTHAKTKADCRRKARTLKIYSAPAKPLRKVVAVQWKENNRSR